MINTANLDMSPKDLQKLKQSGDKIKDLYQKATGKELTIKTDILGQAQPVGKTWYQVKQELKKAIADRPTLVLDLSNITEYTGKQSLKEDSKAIVEATLADRARKQVLSTMTVYDDINLTNANTRDRLIQMMPQSRIEGALFKKDLPMTIKRKGENLEIIQYHGQENIPGAKGEKRAVDSRITIDKGDISLFNEIAKYVDFDESNRMSYSAEKFKSFEESKPQVNNNKDRKDSNYETKNAVAVAKSVQNNPEIARPFIVSKNPQIWSTAPLIEKNMKGYLTTIVGEEQAKSFTEEYMKNINSFRIRPVTAMSPLLGAKTWSLEIYNPYNKKLDVKDLGVQNMDKDTKYLIDHQPEVYISEFLAQSIKEDPKFINAVFKQ